jgi:signal transduction histidine kinase
VRAREDNAYHAWLWGELLLLGLLGAGLALFLAYPSLPTSYALPELGLVLATAIALAAAVLAVLAGIRFSVEGRRFDLLLATGFFLASASTLAFGIAPRLGGGALTPAEAWSGIAAWLASLAAVAAAPFVRGRSRHRERALGEAIAGAAVLLCVLWSFARAAGPILPELETVSGSELPRLLIVALALQALLSLVALVGFGLRFRAGGEDLDRWLALGATLMTFGALNDLFAPEAAGEAVSQGELLRVLAFGVLLAGAWRAVRAAEFGRAVAEERARVAREIHDGLAQYLFALSTHATMLEGGAPLETTLPRLKEAAAMAQQEARFAVLALSSAGGASPFDTALRRYVEFLTADGLLEVELEIDPGVALAPDEQIEVFRIVQEGLANARKHAGATRVEVTIGARGERRVVTIRDHGDGFEESSVRAGQGLRNMRERAAAIGGAFSLRTGRGAGTALEVVLRA